VTQILTSPHPSDSLIPDPDLNKTPTRDEIKDMIKQLPSDKSAGPDGITNRILQAGGEQAIDMIYLYMLIIWETETYPGAWASALMQPIYKGGGKDRHSPVSYRGIYLLNTLTKLFEGLIEARLSKFTELHDTLTPSQQGSRITRQTHDAIYALIATIQQHSQHGFASYCCFIDFATAYPSVHRERLGLTLKNYKITGKIWQLLKENSRSVRVRVLHALIDPTDEVEILRGLPEGSRLSPTLFGICVAELILELRAKFPHLVFPEITSIDDLNWIGAFLYVDDMVLIARSPAQLQSMIDACQDWAERSRMRINHDKTEIMIFYETPPQRAVRHPSTFHITTRFPLSQPPKTLPLKEPPTFKYLGLTLDPYLTMEAAMKHICRKINAAHETVAAVAHSLRHDSPATERGIRSSPYVLFRIWQPCVLGFATEHLRYLVTNTQIATVERTLIHSLQRTLHCFTTPHITMIELGIPPLALQQALQLVALHFRYTVLHTSTIAAKLYTLRCQFRCSNKHPPQSLENRIAKAHSTLMISSSYPGPPPMPRSVFSAKPKNRGKSYTTFLKPLVSAEWLRQIRLQYPNAPLPPSGHVSSRPHAHFLLHHLSLCNNLYKLPPYLTMCAHRNTMSLLRLRSQSHQSIPTHILTIDDNRRDSYDDRMCLYCPSGVTGSEIHLILECPATSHVARDLILLLTDLLLDTCQPAWDTLTNHQQTSLILGDPPVTLPKKHHHAWLKSILPPILEYVSQLEKTLYNM
jgi:hypothetical protein